MQTDMRQSLRSPSLSDACLFLICAFVQGVCRLSPNDCGSLNQLSLRISAWRSHFFRSPHWLCAVPASLVGAARAARHRYFWVEILRAVLAEYHA